MMIQGCFQALSLSTHRSIIGRSTAQHIIRTVVLIHLGAISSVAHLVAHGTPNGVRGRDCRLDGWQNYGKTRDNGVTMASDSNITLPAELLAQVQALAAKEGKTVDELMVEAVKRDIARRMIANLKREGKPSGMAEDGEIQAAVDAVHEYRGR
jgi:fructose-1,6-bisphosphatase/sedoheptulose 1,7-bisphosphatase-like protein